MTNMTRLHGPTLALLLAPALLTTLGGCSDGSDGSGGLPPSSLSVAPVAAPEGPAGTTRELLFQATLAQPQPLPVVIRYQSAAGTATAGQDYLETSGEVEIAPGDLRATIPVMLLGDDDEEAAETFELQLGTSANAVIAAATVTGTIANDDTACTTAYSKMPNPWLRNGLDPLNFAHRGGVTDFPENTLYAYGEASRIGADVLETDIFRTADNQLVVIHDRDVDRTTNGSGPVESFTLAELRALDAAYWFIPGEGTRRDRPEEDYLFRGIATGDKPPPPGYAPEDFRIPTLEEVLARFPRDRVNLDLKSYPDSGSSYEEQVAELLLAYGRFDDVIAVSFVDEAAQNFKNAAPCVHTATPLGEATTLVLRSLGDGSLPRVPAHVAMQVPPDTDEIPDRVPPGFFLQIVSPDFVADAHNANLAVHVWTINDCEEMLQMIDLGVDGIMTDQPVLLEQLLSTPASERSCQ